MPLSDPRPTRISSRTGEKKLQVCSGCDLVDDGRNIDARVEKEDTTKDGIVRFRLLLFSSLLSCLSCVCHGWPLTSAFQSHLEGAWRVLIEVISFRIKQRVGATVQYNPCLDLTDKRKKERCNEDDWDVASFRL